MVYKYLNSAKIDSDNCWDWEPHFRVCMQQPLNGARAIFRRDGHLVLNQLAIEKAEANTNWGVVRERRPGIGKTELGHISGLGKSLDGGEQIFIIKHKRECNFQFIHEWPGTVIDGPDVLTFDAYEVAVKYAISAHYDQECSLWQFCGNRFELLHDFCYK